MAKLFARHLEMEAASQIFGAKIKQEEPKESESKPFNDVEAKVKVKDEPDMKPDIKPRKNPWDLASNARALCSNNKTEVSRNPSSKKSNYTKKENVEDRIVNPVNVENGEFPEEPEWYLVGRTFVTALSTTKGRKLVDNEIVNFAFPASSARYNLQWIVRFSTKRCGEIGRLPMERAKCVVPLVHSGKVKVLGRCIAAPVNLHIMQEIMLYVSFFIHHSIFTLEDTSSWKLEASSNIDSTIYPILTLFKLLKIKPYQEAEFTPEELVSRKRLLNLEA